MPFTGAFSISQNLDASGFVISDTSAVNDDSVTERRIYLKKADGTYLVPDDVNTDYIVWAINTNPLIVTDLFAKDYALEIQVDWITDTPEEGGVYTFKNTFVFKSFLEQFDYNLTQIMAANPKIVNDNPFFNNKCALRVYIENAVNAVLVASDTINAQYNLDKGTYMMRNANIYF